jgi:hypothetical protein
LRRIAAFEVIEESIDVLHSGTMHGGKLARDPSLGVLERAGHEDEPPCQYEWRPHGAREYDSEKPGAHQDHSHFGGQFPQAIAHHVGSVVTARRRIVRRIFPVRGGMRING